MYLLFEQLSNITSEVTLEIEVNALTSAFILVMIEQLKKIKLKNISKSRYKIVVFFSSREVSFMSTSLKNIYAE